jgi:hypothetical protein
MDRQLAKVFHHPAPCISLIQPPFRRFPAIAVFPQDLRWRSTTLGPTDPVNGRRAPSCLRPPRLEPYAADVHLDMVASLEYALLLQYPSSLYSAGSSIPGPSGRSSRRLALIRRRAHHHARSLAIRVDRIANRANREAPNSPNRAESRGAL